MAVSAGPSSQPEALICYVLLSYVNPYNHSNHNNHNTHNDHANHNNNNNHSNHDSRDNHIFFFSCHYIFTATAAHRLWHMTCALLSRLVCRVLLGGAFEADVPPFGVLVTVTFNVGTLAMLPSLCQMAARPSSLDLPAGG